LLGFRTLEQISRAGCDGNQGFQRGSEGIIAGLMLLDPGGDLDLLPFQGARFFVVLALSNSPRR